MKRFEIDIGRTVPLYLQNVAAELAFSPDGKRLAYTAIVDGIKRLYVRELDKTESIVLPGTEYAWSPFFSPDGMWIGFHFPRERKLKKVSISGGDPQVLCDAYPPTGGAWLEDGTIVFTGQDDELLLNISPNLAHLFRVSANGGVRQRLTKADGPGRGEWSHMLPSRVPGGNQLLFTIGGNPGHRHVALLDLETGQYEKILENAVAARYAASEHIIFARDDALWAVPFDPETGTKTGKEALIQSKAQMNLEAMAAPFAISDVGSFIYVPLASVVTEPQRTLVWVDHAGSEETIAVPPAKYYWPRVSPDGTRVAFVLRTEQDDDEDVWIEDIWIHDFERAQSLTRFTFDSGRNGTPVWSPDGRDLFFISNRFGDFNFFRRRADGTGDIETIYESPQFKFLMDMTSDRATFIYGQEGEEEQDWDIWAVTVGSERKGQSTGADPTVQPLLDTRYSEGGAKLSPDGNWLAYSNDVTGSVQVYVRPYPNLDDGRWPVSTDGGHNATWSADGKEIYYTNGTKMMAVLVETEPMFRPGTPRELFDGDYYMAPDFSRTYDLEYPERKRFLMIKNLPDMTTTKLLYVENWFEELKRLAPRGK